MDTLKRMLDKYGLPDPILGEGVFSNTELQDLYDLLVIAGVVLSTLHQSSLGTVYLIVPGKLHPLWYTDILPILFWVSAAAVGLAMVIVESKLAARALGHHLERPLLTSVGRALVGVLGLYGVLSRFDALPSAPAARISTATPTWGSPASSVTSPETSPIGRACRTTSSTTSSSSRRSSDSTPCRTSPCGRCIAQSTCCPSSTCGGTR